MDKYHKYYVYILTNIFKTVLYIGVTNNLEKRLSQHKYDAMTEQMSFAERYKCVYLLYFEEFQWVTQAIQREKELKKWGRPKKLALIKSQNPNLDFLNHWD